ncbi:hypothetical protein JYU34_015583 [Plutella xylostella]|uniref:Peptidase aspartic putative domain-containing protein n=1 Tax=Plutella xylostella TaxID=51655 RepID=A0ABQ7Q478_PLUXY|nr:hypothetical protein JYU34_015583 [Plutella xylostella]
MENELKSLKVLRAQLKGTFTRMQSFVNDASFSNANVEMLQARKDKLNSTLKDYEKVQLDILTIDDQDGESMGHLEEKYFTIISKINERLKQLNSIETSSNSNVSTSKLPNIDLPVFSGKDFTKYTSFMDMFTAVIHNNNTLSDVQKLFYLRKYLSDDALSVIINLPIVNESYKEALTLLKKRFDNQTRLILNHINIILELPSMQKGTATSIRSFISEVEQQLYALKNLKQPTHEWDMMLIAILTKKLDQFTNRAYQLERNSDSLPTMVEFLSFLEKRAMALEDSGTYESYHKKFMQKSVSNVVTNNICKFCNGSNHAIHGCPSFKMAPIEVRHNFISSNKLCTICLKSHFGIKCKFNFQCQKCKKGHNTLLHMDAKPNNDQAVTLSCNDSLKNVVLPTIRVKLFDVQGREFFVRALLDSGSQASFVLSSLSNRLGLKAEPQETNVVSFGNKSSMLNKCVKITLHSPVSNVQLNVNCLITDTITTHLPQNPIDISKLILPANMVLSDDNFNIPAEISLLLGADIYFNILLNNQIKLEGGLLLQNTLFGYVVGGSCVGQNLKNRDLVSNHLTICDHEKLENVMERFWDTEKIPEADVKNAPAIQKAEKCFQDSVKVIDKKFYVDMPLSVDNIEQLQLGDSFSVAFQRFLALEKKFQKYPSYFELYKNFVDEYINLGHAKIVDISSYNLPNDLVYFLGHHAVMNPDSKTTKLRVVFQGNLKSKSGVSLNDVLLNGPVVQSELFDILLLFRTYKFTLISDVKKMFRAINLNPYQNGLQKILWRDNPTKPISCLQLQTVTYGLKPSTFLATRCLIELANNYEDEFPLAAQALRSCTYVDDVLAGADDVEQLYKLKSELIALLDKGSFQLHKWCSNFPGVLDDVPIEHRYFDEVELTNNNMIKTLGLTLNVVEDTFNFTGPIVPQTLKTKRQVLSAIGKIFDPLGLIGPIVIQAKLFMQELWSMSLDWDTILPDKQLQFWNSLLNTIISMEVLTIPRYISSTNMLEVELIGYCDASMKAYGCCLYLRIINNDGSILVNLLCSKTRVAPLNKTLTIPRLELNSAVLLSQLTHRVYNKLKLKLPFKVFLYSDSQITLAWIKSLKIKSNPYVTNRVKDINNLTHGFQWSYVNTTKNPADLLTRSIDPKKLQTTELWWHATPDLLSKDFKHLPVEVNYPIPVNTETLSFPVNYCRVEQPDEIIEIFNKYSDLNKLQRIVAYILRFKNNCLNKNGNMMGSLTPIELNDALNIIIRSVQRKYLSNEIESLLNEKPIKSNLSSLHPFLDQYGILRVGGRLQNASNITYEKMHPIILPKHTYITKLIIEREHLRLLHAGP